MSCDPELTNQWTRCSGKSASYITMHFVYFMNILLKRRSRLNSLFKNRTLYHLFMGLNRASEQNEHWTLLKCLHINGNSKIIKFVYWRHDCTETLSLRMTRSEMDCNLKILASNFSHSLRQNQKCTIYYSSCKKKLIILFLNSKAMWLCPHHFHSLDSETKVGWLKLFFLSSFWFAFIRHNSEAMIHMGLSLLTVALESGSHHIGTFPSLMYYVKDDMCKNLFWVSIHSLWQNVVRDLSVKKEVALIFLSLSGPRPCTQFRAEDLHLWPSAIFREHIL